MKKFGTAIAIGMKDKEPRNADLVIAPVSTDPEWYPLSPFFLGPVRTPDGVRFQNFENLWQYSKVYEKHLDLGGSVFHGEINSDWYAWHLSGAESNKAVRYPMGKGTKALFSKWGELRLSYVAARKQIYVPQYAMLVTRERKYRQLLKQYKKGANIVLRDYDAYDIFKAYDDKPWVQAINNKDRKFGHGFTLALCLQFHQVPLWYNQWVI